TPAKAQIRQAASQLAPSPLIVGAASAMGYRRPFPSGTAHPYPAAEKGVQSQPLKLPKLTCRFLAGNSVSLLDLTDELITPAFNDLPVIISQSAPLLLCLADELLPVPFHLVGVHCPLHSVSPNSPTASTGFGFRSRWCSRPVSMPLGRMRVSR